MSRIDEMIARFCPDGVPFAALSDIAKTVPGLSGKSKDDFADGNARFVPYKNVFANISVDQDAVDLVKVGAGERQNRLHAGDVVFTGSSESTDEVGMSSVVTTEPTGSLYLNSFCFAVRFTDQHILLPGFSKYLFRSDSVRSQIRRAASGVTRINISKDRFIRVRIPVPPIDVQREIVGILDTFTQLEAELEAELEARRRQYEHYRTQLLTPLGDGKTQWTTLGDVSRRVSSGGTPLARKAAYYEGGTIPWLRTQEVRFVDILDTEMRITERALKETSASWIPENCVIIAISGATAGRSAVNKIPLTTNQHCCNFEIDPMKAHYRYVFYWVRSQYEQIRALGQGARADLNASIIKSVKLPLPSLADQQLIVANLDQFDALVNDISVGLPAELAARRKQYEYYRDKLLTFEELV
jgi:type I restriction enzyme S subunit